MRRAKVTLVRAACAASLFGCTSGRLEGELASERAGEPSAEPSGGDGNGGTVAPPRPGGTPREDPPFAPTPGVLHRLTRSQYLATVDDLLGPGLVLPADLEVDTPLHGFTTVGASSLTIGPRAVEQYEAAAFDLARQLFEDPSRRAGFVGCEPADASDPCVATFVRRFGRRAFRRPLDEMEVGKWTALVADVSLAFRDVWAGVELLVTAMLESPNFLYRVELGAPDSADPSRRAYTGYEMASRLSYFITGSTPDDALLDAAERGDLDLAGGVAREAARLSSLPRARTGLIRFFEEHLRLGRLEGLSKSPELFPQMTGTLAGSMKTEVLLLLEDIVLARDADVREMLDAREIFVNAELARLYGIPAPPDGFAKVRLPDNSPRRGVLTSGALMALNAHATVTSPTLRGKFIRQSLLCQEIPPPPEGVITQLPETDPNAPPETLRQRLERVHLSQPTCAGCHSLMDPLGFAFEHFDALGAYRTTDNGLAVDASGRIENSAFGDARELAELLRSEDDVGACLARMAYRYATGHLETEGERRVLGAIAPRFAAEGHRFSALVAAVVTSDGFRYAAGE